MKARLGNALKVVLPSFVLARVIVVGALLLGYVIADQLLPGQARPLRLSQGLLSWDGDWYRDIVAYGYDKVGQTSLRFFPLFPILTMTLRVIVRSPGLAVLLVANACSLGFSVGLHELVVAETGDTDLARRSVWIGALVPPAAVLVMGYSESLIMVLAVGVFYCIRVRKNWWLASVLGLLAGLCRPIGFLMCIPIAIEIFRHRRVVMASAAALVAPVAGSALWLGYVGLRYRDALLPVTIQADTYHRRFQDPFTRFLRAAKDLIHGPLAQGLHFPWAVLFIGLSVVAFRRLPASYGAYGLTVVVVALASNNIDSFERYGLSAFPLIIAAAMLTRRESIDKLVLLGCSAGLVIYSSAIFMGAYVP